MPPLALRLRSQRVAILPERTRCAAGFTLIEILIAVLIAGILLVSVYGSVAGTLQSKEVAEERAALFAAGRDAVMRMADEIEAALPPTAGDRILFRGSSEGSMSAPRGHVEFVAVNRGKYGANRIRPGQVYISYSLDPLPNRRNLFALRRDERLWAALIAEADGLEFPMSEDGPPVYAAMYLLDCPDLPNEIELPGNCIRVAGLQFRYMDLDGGWHDEWDTVQELTGPVLPSAVEITLSLMDREGGQHDFMTYVDLPLARGQPTPRPGGGPAETEDEEGQDDQE